MTAPVRVLYLAHSVSGHGGGMERMGRELVRGTDDVLWTVMASDGLEDLPDHVDVIRIALPRRPAFLRIAWFYLRSSQLVRRYRDEFDVVHSCGAITRPYVDVATVHLCHAAVPKDARDSMRGWRHANATLARRLGLFLERRQYRPSRVGELVAVSPSVERELAQWYLDVPRSLIANGVDVASWRIEHEIAATTAPLTAILVTSDFALKGVALAIRALATSPDVTLRIVGKGPVADFLALAEQCGVSDRVTFYGYLADLTPLYASSDVVVCVSNYESFGLYLVEAALAGCAVVATDVGVARALIDHGGGVLIERSAASLSAAWNSLATTRATARSMGERARELASTYTLERMYDAYHELYERLVAGSELRRVLHVGLESLAIRRGGLNRYLTELARAQRDAGDHVEIVWIADEVQVAGVTAVPAGLSWPRRARAFARVIRHSRAAVVDVHFAAHAYWALRTGALRRRPLVVNFQGPWALESRSAGGSRLVSRIKSHVEGYVLRRADLVVTLSNAFRRVAVERYRVAPHRVVVLAPGVAEVPRTEQAEARRSLGIAEVDELWLSVRRLVPRMGLNLALEAFARGGTERRRLTVVGDGPLRETLEERAAALGIAHAVTFTGAVDDETLAAWYAAADVSLVPSVAHEGFGLVVGESLAHGTPVVATNVDGLRDAARGSAAVVVCDPDAESLAASVADLLSRPTRREDARATADNYPWRNVAHRYGQLYDQLLAGERPHGVVFLDHSAQLSGGELAMARMVSALDDRWRPHVILAEPGPLEQELEARDISFEVVPLAPRTRKLTRDGLKINGRMRTLWDTGLYVARLRARIRTRGPDVVHSNSLKAHVYGAAALFGTRRPLVMHVRDRWAPPYVSDALARRLRSMARWGSDVVLANSGVTAAATGVPTRVLASPVEPAFFAVPPPQPSLVVRVAVIGRLAPWKGQDLALEAVARLAPVVPLHLTVVGDALFGEDEYAEHLRAWVRDRGLEHLVTFVGHLTDIPTFLRDIDVTLLTSRSPEPFGNVVVEAMAAGRVVIVPDRGGVTEFVREDGPRGSGFFYSMDNVDSLVEVLRRVATDEDLRRRVGVNARLGAVPFRAESLAGVLEQLYDDLV